MTKTNYRRDRRTLGRASDVTRGGPIGTLEVAGFEQKYGIARD
ncbi:hypothetical protein ABDK56_09595 [Sphingomonas sp. ASV193]